MTENIQVQKGNLTVEKTFSVSGKDIPTLENLKVRIVYKDMNEVLQCAAGQTVVYVQAKLRKLIGAKQAIPFKPGVLVTVDAQGNYTLSPEEKQKMMLEGAIRRAQEDKNVKRQLLRGLGISEEKIDEIMGKESEDSEENSRESDDSGYENYKYSPEWLERQQTDRLRVLAQKEELEGYSELGREELLEELGLVER